MGFTNLPVDAEFTLLQVAMLSSVLVIVASSICFSVVFCGDGNIVVPVAGSPENMARRNRINGIVRSVVYKKQACATEV